MTDHRFRGRHRGSPGLTWGPPRAASPGGPRAPHVKPGSAVASSYLMPASRRRWSLPLCVARQARAGARRPRLTRARPWCASRGGLPRWPGCGAFIAACSSSRSRASSRPDSAPRPPAAVGRPVSRSKAAMGERRSAVVYACRALAEVGDFGVSAPASRSGRRRSLMRQRRVTDAPSPI